MNQFMSLSGFGASRPSNQSWSFGEFFAVFLLLFFASGVSALARSFITWDTPFGVLIVGGAALWLATKRRVRLGSRILSLLFGYWILFLIQFFVFESFHPKHMVYYPFYFLVTYVYLFVLRDKVYFYLEDSIFYLVLAGLFFWVVDVFTGSGFRSSISGVQVLPAYDDIIGSYIFFYTVVLEGVDAVIYRNSGFAWEPGAFAVFSCIGLYLSLIRKGFSIIGNSRAIIFMLAIVSTQSTTGYMILLIVIISKIWKTVHRSFRLLTIPIVIGLLIGVLNIPFMYNKVVELMDEDVSELADKASQNWNIDKPVAAQRLLSFKLDFDDFTNNPLTGYGGRESEMGIRKQNLNIVTVSGVGRALAKFGIFGFSFFVFATYRSSIYFSRKFGYNADYLLFFIIMFIGVSYYLIDLPVMMVFWLSAYFSEDWIKSPDRF